MVKEGVLKKGERDREGENEYSGHKELEHSQFGTIMAQSREIRTPLNKERKPREKTRLGHSNGGKLLG